MNHGQPVTSEGGVDVQYDQYAATELFQQAVK